MSEGPLEITNITGHRFILDKEKRTLTIMNPGTDQRLTLDDLQGTVSITDASGDALTFDAAQKKLVIDFQNAITIQVQDVSLTLSPDGKAVLSSPLSVTVESPGIKLGGSATLALVNERLLDLFNNHVHAIQSAGATDKPSTQGAAAQCLTQKTKGE